MTLVTTKHIAKLCGCLLAALALLNGCEAIAQKKSAAKAKPLPPEMQMKNKLNEWTLGLAGGLLEGAPIRLATEIARVVNDGENLHVLPIVTRGPTENLNDLLFLKGVDMAIISSDSLEEYKQQLPDVSRRHCRFVFADGIWRVFDLNSLNGIYVNGERLHEATINHGDRIRIGSLTFEVEVGAEQTAAPVGLLRVVAEAYTK